MGFWDAVEPPKSDQFRVVLLITVPGNSFTVVDAN
jgi:hypothetical protein